MLGLFLLLWKARLRTVFLLSERRIIHQSTRFLILKTERKLNFSDISDVILGVRAEGNRGHLHSLTLVTNDGESLQLEYGHKNNEKRAVVRDDLRALILGADASPRPSATSQGSHQELSQGLLQRTEPASVDVPVELRSRDSVSFPRRLFRLLHRLSMPDPSHGEEDALELLDLTHRQALQSAEFRYLGDINERMLITNITFLVFVDPSQTVMVHYEPTKKNYSIYTYFDNGSLLATWASQTMEKTMGQTAECVHQSGSGSLSHDLVGHGLRRNERALEGIRPVSVPSLEEVYRLSRLYYDHIIPSGTALQFPLIVIITGLTIIFYAGLLVARVLTG